MTSETTPTGDSDKTSRPKWLVVLLWPVNRWRRIGYGWRVAICAGLYILLAFFTVLNAPRWLLGEWIPKSSVDDQGKLLGTAGNLVLLALGGVIAVVTVGLSLARHRQEVEAADRDRQRLELDRAREQARIDEVEDQRKTETERALRARFVTTVQLLSDSAPVNRQAALYALGALADDWEAFGKADEVQVCIEVIAGYLRAPRSADMLLPLEAEEAYYTEPEDYYASQRTTPQEVAVKHAGFTVIRNHLQRGRSPHWHDRHINLSRVHIDFPVDLIRSQISDSGVLDFRDARISHDGNIDLAEMSVSSRGRVLFANALVVGRGRMNLRSSAIVGRATVDLTHLLVSGGRVDISNSTIADAGNILARAIRVTHKGRMRIRKASVFDNGFVDLSDSRIETASLLDLRRMVVSEAGSVEIDHSTLESSGEVDFSHTTIDGRGRLGLEGVKVLNEGRISFRGVVVESGAVVDIAAVAVTEGGGIHRPDGTFFASN